MLAQDMDDEFFSDHFNDEDVLDNGHCDTCFATQILDALYNQMSIKEVVKLQTHLRPEQQRTLLGVLSKYEQVFSNDLGCYPHKIPY